MVSHSFPFEIVGSRVWVRAKVIGHDLFGILDTGADGTAIDSKVASSIGLVAQGVENASVEADEFELAKSGPTSFHLGTVQLEAKQVYLVPLAARIADLDFIMGVDLFAQTPLTIDYHASRIELSLRAGREFSFASSTDLRPSLTMEIHGTEVIGTLDTGSSGGLSLPLGWVEKYAKELKVTLGDGSERKLLGEGKLRFQNFKLDKVTIGGVTIDDVIAEAVVSEKGSASDQTSNWASIGNKVLERLGPIGIDCKRRIVCLGARRHP